MDINFTDTYKSLGAFSWANLPMFAVITGTNGSGKTQLLELIHRTILLDPHVKGLTIQHVSYAPGEVSFLKSEWQLSDVGEESLMSIQQEIHQLYQNYKQPHNRDQNPKVEFIFRQIDTKVARARQTVTLSEFETHFPVSYFSQDDQMSMQVAKIFVDYNTSRRDAIVEGKSDEEIIAEFGPAPWIVLNESMKAAKLPFVFNDPTSGKTRDTFKLTITDTVSGSSVQFSSLSSGEKVLVSLIFMLYGSKHNSYFPKLILMDEPDAHLHPSMAKQFLDVVESVFVKEHSIRVLMTTHSPSTVALTPEDSLFEMSKTAPRITKSTSKNKTVSLLTAGLVIVGKGTKYYLVEDQDDVDFYQEIYGHLISKNLISGAIPLVFIPASTSTKSGGTGQVYGWVDKLSASGLEDVVRGIIDKDSGNPTADGIYMINRYSFENYLLDPIIVYAALMDSGSHPSIPGISLALGEEYKLLTLPEADLQKIADAIHATVSASVATIFAPDGFTASENILEPVQLVTGQTLNYPNWLLRRRGKTLMNEVYNKAFPGNKVQRGSLSKAFKKTHILPMEMKDFFEQLEQ